MKTNNETTVLKNEKHWEEFGFKDEKSFVEDYTKADDYASDCVTDLLDEIKEKITNAIIIMGIDEIILRHQNDFKDKYGQYVQTPYEFYNEDIDRLFKFSCNEGNVDKFIDDIADPIGESIFNNFYK